MGFAHKKGANYDGNNVILKLEPGLYKGGKIIEVRKDTIPEKDDKEAQEILTFIVANAAGEKHQHTEYDPGDDEKKQANSVARIGHILSKGFAKKEADAVLETNQAESWEELRDWVMDVYTKNKKAFDAAKVDFKIVGDVYNNKAKAEFPGYLGFIVRSGEDIAISTKEQETTDKYTAFRANQASRPKAGGNGTTADPDDDLPF